MQLDITTVSPISCRPLSLIRAPIATRYRLSKSPAITHHFPWSSSTSVTFVCPVALRPKLIWAFPFTPPHPLAGCYCYYCDCGGGGCYQNWGWLGSRQPQLHAAATLAYLTLPTATLSQYFFPSTTAAISSN